MTTPEIILAAVVFLIGVPSAFKNLTAAALVASYATVQGIYEWTQEPLLARQLISVDLVVIAAIYCKYPTYDCSPYRSVWSQLACLWLERSWWDRVVLSLFPAAWYFYCVADPMLHWWGLYFVALAQFFAAGGEALSRLFPSRAANADYLEAPDVPSSGAEFACPDGVRGYG